MRRLSLGSFVCVAATACGSPAARPAAQPIAPAAPSASAAAAPAPAPVIVVASLDAIAARGATDAPLMREIMRVPDAANANGTLIEVKDRDACFRAVVAASQPVRVWFEDAKNAKRGEPTSSTSASSSTPSAVPPRGPVCAKKGETLKLVVVPADSTTDKPSADKNKPSADKPSADRPNADKPNADKPNADKPNADKPSADKPNADKPVPMIARAVVWQAP